MSPGVDDSMLICSLGRLHHGWEPGFLAYLGPFLTSLIYPNMGDRGAA
jgi:hypothetical protein